MKNIAFKMIVNHNYAQSEYIEPGPELEYESKTRDIIIDEIKLQTKHSFYQSEILISNLKRMDKNKFNEFVEAISELEEQEL